MESLLGAPTSKGSVEEYSWEELSAISEEIAKESDENSAIEVAKKYNLCTAEGRLDGTQVKTVTLTDGTETTVQIVGFAHDEKTGGEKAGITFIFGNAIGKEPMNEDLTNAGGWEKSFVRAWLADQGMFLLPEDLKSKIVAVNKLTNNVGYTSDVASVTTTSDKLWLFSMIELHGVVDYPFYEVLNAEGAEYKLFREVNTDWCYLKSYKANPIPWWKRSMDCCCGDWFSIVAVGFTRIGGYSCGIVPGFCI